MVISWALGFRSGIAEVPEVSLACGSVHAYGICYL